MTMDCGVCGGTEFRNHAVLWPKLIADWQLSQKEVDYVNRQQGTCCARCGSNLRSIALANAIRSLLNTSAPLADVCQSSAFNDLSILELNEAGTLSPYLRKMPRYTFGAYPDVDMHKLPYAEGTFDLVVHSDTLEHVPNPVHALDECRRVLKFGGALCFTVPTIVGRMSRDRNGLEASYHGVADTAAQDWAVQTEFGADAWTYVVQAGFTEVSIHSLEYPAAFAYVARKAS